MTFAATLLFLLTTAHADGRDTTFYYNPFHALENPIGAPQAQFEYDSPRVADLESAVALFDAAEFNRFKGRLVARETYHVDSDAAKARLGRILGLDAAESAITPCFKFALALSPLPYAVEAALATLDLVNALPGSVTRTQARLATLLSRGGMVDVSETIESTGSAWIYSRVVSYQVAVGDETAQVILGASHLRAEIR